MKAETAGLAALVLFLPLFALGCDEGSGDSSTSSGDSTETGEPTCEVGSVVQMADADEVAPNGQTGAKILAQIPESLHTTLHWDLSSASGIEVQVEGVTGQSSALDLTFALPAEPIFEYVDYIEVDVPDNLAFECEDVVRTTMDITAVTEDGTLELELQDVEVFIGPDRPRSGYWAKPMAAAMRPLASPSVDFLSPVTQPSDSEKLVAMTFDAPAATGSITVWATASGAKHRMVVARW